MSITCQEKHQSLPKTSKQVGIDLGIKDLVVCSDGVVFKNPRITKKHAKKLSYEQRQLSKKKRGSGKRNKQKRRVSLVHERIRNTRKDYLHKTSHKLISENQAVVIEDLNVVGMIKNRYLSKSIADASWGELTRQLEYKSAWNGRQFVKIDRWFPSSKTCHVCDFIKQDLILNDREWQCPSCNSLLDRDLNAAKNILKQGLKILSGSGVRHKTKTRGGVCMSRVYETGSSKALALGSSCDVHFTRGLFFFVNLYVYKPVKSKLISLLFINKLINKMWCDNIVL